MKSVSKNAFAQFIGQDHAKNYLEKIVLNNQVSHSYVFKGPRGVGKGPAATAFAQALLCSKNGCGSCDDCIQARSLTHPRLYVIDQFEQYDINKAREITELATRGDYIFILNMSNASPVSQNLLLKTLEEPHDSIFILIADQDALLLDTINSRSITLYFYPLSLEENTRLLMINDIKEQKAFNVARLSNGNYELAMEIAKEKTDYYELAIALLQRNTNSKAIQDILALKPQELVETKSLEKETEDLDDDTQKRKDQFLKKRLTENTLQKLILVYQQLLTNALGSGVRKIINIENNEITAPMLINIIQNLNQAKINYAFSTSKEWLVISAYEEIPMITLA